MFSIYDGRDSFYQWDINRKLIVEDSSIKEVHFCNKTDDCSLVVETYEEDGKTLANVPNILLQSSWKIRVFGYTGDFTKYEKCFKVNARSKPADYIYTETELKNYEDFENRLEALEQGGNSAELGDKTECSFSVLNGRGTTGKYVNNEGNIISQKGSHYYRYYYDEIEYPQFIGSAVKIKTYMYGDMAIMIEDYDNDEIEYYTNENADIENNPESGICEFEVVLPNSYGGVNIVVSFYENEYMTKPSVISTSSAWKTIGEVADSKADAIEFMFLSDDFIGLTSWVEEEIARLDEEIANGGSGGEDYSKEIEELTAHLEDTENPHNVMYEQIYDSDGWDIDYITDVKIGNFLTPYFDKNGVSQNIIESSNTMISDFRIYKTITLSQQSQTKYFPFQMEAYGSPSVLYFQANVISDTDYNTRVVNYSLDYDEEDSNTVWGININVASDIPQGQTTKATIAAHFYMTGY